MAVEYPHSSPVPEGSIVADRHLYLDASGTTVVEEGDARSASQLVASGRHISKEDADRLGLSVKDGKVVQDHPAKIEDLRTAYDALVAEQAVFAETIAAYKAEHVVTDIPNTMEAERVALEAKVEQARLTLAQSIKASEGRDPLKGESQATSLKPDEGKDPVKAEAAKAAEQEKKPVAKTPAAKKGRG